MKRVCEGVHRGSGCKKVIAWRGAQRVCTEGCVEGLSAKRSLRREGAWRGYTEGVHRGSECKKVIVWRGAQKGVQRC